MTTVWVDYVAIVGFPFLGICPGFTMIKDFSYAPWLWVNSYSSVPPLGLNLELLPKGGPLRFKYDPCENALMIAVLVYL